MTDLWELRMDLQMAQNLLDSSGLYRHDRDQSRG